MLLEIEQCGEICLQGTFLTAKFLINERVSATILLAFDTEGPTRLGDLVAMVDVFYGLFEAYGDEEAEDDGGDVDEEVAPGRGGVVSGVDVERGGWFLVWGGLARFRGGC